MVQPPHIEKPEIRARSTPPRSARTPTRNSEDIYQLGGGGLRLIHLRGGASLDIDFASEPIRLGYQEAQDLWPQEAQSQMEPVPEHLVGSADSDRKHMEEMLKVARAYGLEDLTDAATRHDMEGHEGPEAQNLIDTNLQTEQDSDSVELQEQGGANSQNERDDFMVGKHEDETEVSTSDHNGDDDRTANAQTPVNVQQRNTREEEPEADASSSDFATRNVKQKPRRRTKARATTAGRRVQFQTRRAPGSISRRARNIKPLDPDPESSARESDSDDDPSGFVETMDPKRPWPKFDWQGLAKRDPGLKMKPYSLRDNAVRMLMIIHNFEVPRAPITLDAGRKEMWPSWFFLQLSKAIRLGRAEMSLELRKIYVTKGCVWRTRRQEQVWRTAGLFWPHRFRAQTNYHDYEYYRKPKNWDTISEDSAWRDGENPLEEDWELSEEEDQESEPTADLGQDGDSDDEDQETSHEVTGSVQSSDASEDEELFIASFKPTPDKQAKIDGPIQYRTEPSNSGGRGFDDLPDFDYQGKYERAQAIHEGYPGPPAVDRQSDGGLRALIYLHDGLLPWQPTGMREEFGDWYYAELLNGLRAGEIRPREWMKGEYLAWGVVLPTLAQWQNWVSNSIPWPKDFLHDPSLSPGRLAPRAERSSGVTDGRPFHFHLESGASVPRSTTTTNTDLARRRDQLPTATRSTTRSPPPEPDLPDLSQIFSITSTSASEEQRAAKMSNPLPIPTCGFCQDPRPNARPPSDSRRWVTLADTAPAKIAARKRQVEAQGEGKAPADWPVYSYSHNASDSHLSNQGWYALPYTLLDDATAYAMTKLLDPTTRWSFWPYTFGKEGWIRITREKIHATPPIVYAGTYEAGTRFEVDRTCFLVHRRAVVLRGNMGKDNRPADAQTSTERKKQANLDKKNWGAEFTFGTEVLARGEAKRERDEANILLYYTVDGRDRSKNYSEDELWMSHSAYWFDKMVQEKAWDACATDELRMVDEENKTPAPRRSNRQTTHESDPETDQHSARKTTTPAGSSGKKSKHKSNPVFHIPGHEPSSRSSFISPTSSRKRRSEEEQAGYQKKIRTESSAAPRGQVKSTTDTMSTSDPFDEWMAARDNAAGRDEGPLTDEDHKDLIRDHLRLLRDFEGKQTAHVREMNATYETLQAEIDRIQTMEKLIQDGKATVSRLRQDLQYRHDTQPLKEGVRQSVTWLQNFAKIGTQAYAEVAAASVDKWVRDKARSLHEADPEDIPGAEYEADQEQEMLIGVKAEKNVITKGKGSIIELEDE